jgi:putative SNF2 domain helicase|nr:MAG TPA: Chromatin remodeling complex ATPase [Caudoviricetes sp.]
MSVFSLLRGLKVEVDSSVNKVSISGISLKYVCRDLEKYLGTKMLYNILDKATYAEIKLSTFYLPDFYHSINTLLYNPKFKRRTTSTRELLAIKEELERIPLVANIKKIQNTESVNIPKIDKSKLDKIFRGMKLFDYQDKFIDECIWKSKLLELKGYLLDAPAGSGKSYGSLALMEMLDIDTIIVICPKKAVNDVWDETITRVYSEPQTYSMSLPVLHGPSKPAGFDINDRFIVCHYESLGKLNEYLDSVKIPNKRYSIVLDECHSLNSHNSERSIQFRELNKKINPEFCLWMSGTPIKALGTETLTMFATIDKLFDKSVYRSFLKVFGVSGVYATSVMANRLQLVRSEIKTKGSGVEQFTHKIKVSLKNGGDYTLKTISAKMIDYVKERKAYYQKNAKQYENDFFNGIEVYRSRVSRGRGDTNSFRAGLEDYLVKAKTLHEGYIPTDPKHKQYVLDCNHYEDKVIIPTLPNDVKKIFRKAKSVYKYVDLTIMGEALGNILGKSRSKCNADIVKQLVTDAKVITEDGETYQSNLPDIIRNAQAKTIIFTDYVEVVKETEYQLKLNGFTPISIFGETTSGNGLAMQTKIFKENSEINPLITTFKTLSEAVPLTEANRVIFLNLPFRSGTYEQAVKRANRIGQTLDVDLFEVTLDTGEEPNISTRNEDILKWSEEQVALILGKKVDDEVNRDILKGLMAESPLEKIVKSGIHSIKKSVSSFLNW